MSFYTFLFYLISAVVIGATGVAITRQNLVHAVVYLIFSFFGTAMLFYLFGAPLLAALEIIIYAGAIMVLFLFVVMMIKIEPERGAIFSLARAGEWLPAVAFGLIYMVVAVLLIARTPGMGAGLKLLAASPGQFALFVFEHHWFSIEVVSMLLLLAVVGALQLGGKRDRRVDAERAVKGEE
jgi:NADH-quinone oxidoreductase subunit J